MWAQTRSVIGISLINILLAIGKDGLLAAYLGTTAVSDAFFLAFFIPDMIGNNLMAAALGVATVPFLAKVIHRKSNSEREIESETETKAIYFRLLKEGLGLALVVALFMAAGAPLFIKWIGGGFEPEEMQLALKLLYLMIPTVLVFPVVTVSMALLQVKGHYTRSMSAILIPNGVLLLVAGLLNALAFTRETGMIVLSGAVVFGVLLQGTYLLFLTSKQFKTQGGKRIPPVWDGEVYDYGEDYDYERIQAQRYKVFMGYGVLLLLSQAVLFYERYLGTTLSEGSVSAVSYSYRLSQFPVLLFSYSVAVIAFPELSKAFHKGKQQETREIYQKALRWILVLSVPIALGMSLLRVPLITILFKRFAFDQQSVQMCSEVLMGYGLAVIGQGLILLNIRILVALENLRWPICIMLGIVVLQMIFDGVMVGVVGIGAVGWGALLGTGLGGLSLSGVIFHRLKMNVLEELFFLVKIIYGNGLTFLVALLAMWFWQAWFSSGTFPVQLAYGLVSGLGICGISYMSLKKLKLL